MRGGQLQHHDRKEVRDHAVAERLKPVLGHGLSGAARVREDRGHRRGRLLGCWLVCGFAPVRDRRRPDRRGGEQGFE